jgi:hypothetical protein
MASSAAERVMANLAFYTFGLMRAPWGDPAVRGFEERLERVFAESRQAPGYVDGVSNAGVEERFGPWTLPSYVGPIGDGRVAATVSVWGDLESVFAFAYGGNHGEALRKRRDWFVPETGWPSYCAWWVPASHVPTFPESVERAEHLHAHGPTPFAFDFRACFDANGRAYVLDRAQAADARRPIPGPATPSSPGSATSGRR